MAKETPSPLKPSLVAYLLACRGAATLARAMRMVSGWKGEGLPNTLSAANPANPLLEYFDKHNEGRGIWKWRHYFEGYERHLGKFVGQEVHLLEIGVYSGGSLEMWRRYLGPQCKVYGVDIEPACQAYADDGVRIFIGDQADPNFWETVKKEVPVLDIVIDDGGHKPGQQIVTLEALLPHLRPGGIYLCEDVQGVSQRFADYISGLVRSLNATALKTHSSGLESSASPFQSAIHSIHSYPFLTVIERTSTPVAKFAAPKQGTQWQPFL